MPTPKKYKLTKTQEQELREKLARSLLTMTGIAVTLVITLVFFAPKIGVFFGFFSAHKNDKDPLDSIKPSPPLLVNVPKTTKENVISLNGFAAEGLTINLFVNGPIVDTTTVGADGQFTFNDVALIDGTNTIFAKATDSFNNESDSSTTYTLALDKQKPEIEIESPKENAVVRNLDKRIIIIGKVSEKAQIVINEKTAVQRPDLTFEFLLGVNDGDVEIKIEAMDEAGNTSEKTLKVKYVRGS